MSEYRHKTTIQWAIRALLPLTGYRPIVVEGGVGRVGVHVVCVGNFDKVEKKRRGDYEEESRSHPEKLPIWC